jgi:hypothetical protein
MVHYASRLKIRSASPSMAPPVEWSKQHNETVRNVLDLSTSGANGCATMGS